MLLLFPPEGVVGTAVTDELAEPSRLLKPYKLQEYIRLWGLYLYKLQDISQAKP